MKTFSRDPDLMLWIALTAQKQNVRASSLLNIQGDVRRLGFDLAATNRLLFFEREKEENRLKSERVNMFRAFAAVMSENAKLFDDHELEQTEDLTGVEVW